MDTRQDNLQLGAAAGVPMVDELASALKNFAGNIRHKAQLKKGMEYIQSGNLSAINGGMLDRLIEANVNPAYYVNAPVYKQRIIDQPMFAQAMQARLAQFGMTSGGPSNTQPVGGGTVENELTMLDGVKKYLPHIIIGGILIFVFYKYVLKK